MKTTSLFALAITSLIATAPSHAQDLKVAVEQNTKSAESTDAAAPAPTVRDATTHRDLATATRPAKADEVLAQFKPSEEPDATKEQGERDLVKQSDILCFQGTATLVPKHAVIHVPERLKSRLELKSGSKIVTWLDFYSKNRGWITVLEVKLPEAEGNTPFDEDRQEWIASCSKVIVATLKGGPISVLSPKSPAPEPEVAAK